MEHLNFYNNSIQLLIYNVTIQGSNMIFLRSQQLFTQLKNAINDTNSDKIPLIARDIESLLAETFATKSPDHFACIIADYIDLAKYACDKQHYEQLAMAFNLSSQATLSLISIVENQQFGLFPAIIFNKCDLRKRCQELEFDVNYILEFKNKVSECLHNSLEEYKEIDIIELLSKCFSTLIPHYLDLNLDRRYLEDILNFVVEQIICANQPAKLAAAINYATKSIDFSKFFDLHRIFDEDSHFRSKLLFSSEDSILAEVALNNGLSAEHLETFKKSVREQVELNDSSECLLLNPAQDLNSLLKELYEHIENIISGTMTTGDIAAYILKINDLFDKSIEHCIRAMLELNPTKFIELINQCVEHGLQNANTNPMVLNFVTTMLFNLDIEDDDLEIIYKTISNPNPEDRKLALAWYLINSKVMNLSKIAEHNAIGFAKYREFKMQAYATLFQHFNRDINHPEATHDINLYSLLQDAYELKDSKKYWDLINKIKETITQLHDSNQQLAIIKLFRIKTSEEIIELFNALDSKNKKQINKAIIDITLRRFSRHHSTLKVIKTEKPSHYLWNKSSAKTNHSFDAAEFRTAVYKECPTFTEDEIKKLELLDLSFSHNWAWSNIQKANLEIDKLHHNGFDKVTDDYKKFLTSELATTDSESITKYRAIRRKLFDYAFSFNDSQKCTRLIELDILWLKEAYKHNVQAKAYSLLSLDYKEIVLLDSLLTSQEDQLIKLFLLQHLDFSNNSFNFEQDPKSALDFKRKVFSELQLNQYDPQFSQFGAIPSELILSIVQHDRIQLKEQRAKIKLLGSYALYSDRNNPHNETWIREVKKMIDTLYHDHPTKLLPLYGKEIISACKSVQENLFYFKSCSDYLYPTDTIRRNNLSARDIETIKHQFDLSNSFQPNRPRELFNGLEQAIVSQNLTNMAVTTLVVDTLFDDALEDLNSRKFANAIIALRNSIGSLIDGIKKIIYKAQGITPSLINTYTQHLENIIFQLSQKTAELEAMQEMIDKGRSNPAQELLLRRAEIEAAITQLEVEKMDILSKSVPERIENIPLLSRFIIREMYKELDGLKKSKFDFNELSQFLLSVRQTIKNHFGDSKIEQSLVDPNSLLPESLSQEHDLIDIKIAAMETREVLEDAWLAKDKAKFTSTINTATKLLCTLYQKRQIKSILVSLDFFKQDDLYVLFRYLEINHENAIKRWLINHYIDHYTLYIKFNIKFVTHHSLLTKENDKFKQDCYDTLGIELADSIDPRVETIISKDRSLIDSLFTSLRTLANRESIDIKKYEQLITLLAKNYCITDKSQFNPTTSDTPRYHELHKIMQAIWNVHIAGHVFSVIAENIKINGFSLAWEGAYGSIMSEYLRTMHLQLLQKPDYSATIRTIDIKSDLIEAMEHGISSNQEDRNKWLESRLQAEQIIAIDIGLYDGGSMGHAVSAVFGKIGQYDVALFADRGVGLENFSGIKIFIINNPSAKKEVLQKLIGTCESKSSSYNSCYQEVRISSATYKNLQNQLKLQELGCIPMFMQLMGNCAFSSSAEPMHLGISFLCFLKSISQQKPHLTFKEAYNLAEESCIELHSYMMHAIYNTTLTNLVKFFEDSRELQIPKELFAHIHIINTYKIKNPTIMSIFNKAHILKTISEEDKDLAYQDYVKHFALALSSISSHIPQQRRILCSQEQLQEYSLHLTTAFLADNCDQDTFHTVSKCIGRSLMFGDNRISPLMLWEFDREFGSLGTRLSAANIEEVEDDADANVSAQNRPRLLT